MHIFRRQIFRILARLLVGSVMLGNTAAVWASIDSALSSNDMASSSCQMHELSDNQQTGHDSCCEESGNCIEHCDTCAGIFTSTVPHINYSMAFNYPSDVKFLPSIMTLAKGVNIGQLHRPPIFSA